VIDEFLAQKKIAVAGSFKNPSKYAYRIVVALKEKGYHVFPVNPHTEAVEGIRCLRSAVQLPGDVTAVSIITPPEATRKLAEELKATSVKYAWMQPGAEDEQAIESFEKNGIHAIHEKCLLVALLTRPKT
jgi:predicted CoA-binding protein